MAKGKSLHIGLNQVDPDHYAGWRGDLEACEADATSMMEIAASCGYEPQSLMTREATRDEVSAAISKAAQQLEAGDIYMVSYAGHGGQVPDARGDAADEPDGLDETWCLYDGEMIDDELFQLWKKFSPGVRVLVFSDSCHSGTVIRLARNEIDLDASRRQLGAFGRHEARFRFIPPEYARRTYELNKEFYDQLKRSVPPERGQPDARVRLISGCQDNQTSADGAFHGLFTEILLAVWNDGAFQGDYAAFVSEIRHRMPDSQKPNHFVIGPDNPAYDQQRPFTIGD